MGRPRYARARSLLITADCGGSSGARVRLWKWELQQLANQVGLTITVCHVRPGTSQWNNIEHRLFAYISRNWRGRPLVSLAMIVNAHFGHHERPDRSIVNAPIGASCRGARAKSSMTNTSMRASLPRTRT